MGAGGWFILKCLAIGIGVFALVAVVFVVGCALVLCGRISREEDGVNYGELVERLRQAEAKRAAQAVSIPAANDHGAPLDLVVTP